MRRLISLSLILVFSWMLIASAFAPGAEASLPACCRRNGKHHCMTRMMMEPELAESPGTHLSAPSEKCPFFPKGRLFIPTSVHFVALPANGTFYAALQSHPACCAQTEAQFRISFDRSRQKRGPPAIPSAS